MTLQGRGSSLAAKEVRDAIGERLMTVMMVMMVVRMMMIMIMRVMVVDDLPATTVTSIS